MDHLLHNHLIYEYRRSLCRKELTMTQFIPLQKTYTLLQEANIDARSQVSVSNEFKMRPTSIIITDTFNNPFYPISKPQIDTSKFDLPDVYTSIREKYSAFGLDFLPFHYIIEFIDTRYYVFATRPLNMQFPMKNSEVNKRFVKDKESARLIFNNEININQSIHICIIGNSNKDVYTTDFYHLIRETLVRPLVKMFKIPGHYNSAFFTLQLGSHFNPHNI